MLEQARWDVRGALLAVSVAGVAAACWVVALGQMSGMDMGPGADLGSFSFFAPTWATMMAAMMLPSALPAVLSFDGVERGRHGAAALGSSIVFAASYLAVWVMVGVGAFLAYRGVRAADVGFLAWDRGGAYLAGAAVVAAGIYELSPLKRMSLHRCRARADRVAGTAVSTGLRYGGDCVGCCAGLMLVLFTLGVMSAFWMLVVTLVVFVEKVLPVGVRSLVPVAMLLVALGLWVALAPSSVPGLTLPM